MKIIYTVLDFLLLIFGGKKFNSKPAVFFVWFFLISFLLCVVLIIFGSIMSRDFNLILSSLLALPLYALIARGVIEVAAKMNNWK